LVAALRAYNLTLEREGKFKGKGHMSRGPKKGEFGRGNHTDAGQF